MLEATLLESIQEIIFTLRRIKFLLLEHIGTPQVEKTYQCKCGVKIIQCTILELGVRLRGVLIAVRT